MAHADHLSDEEKGQLVRDGFVILRNAVSRDVRERAKRVINENPQMIVHGDNDAITKPWGRTRARSMPKWQ